MQRFLLAVAFFTRLPVGNSTNHGMPLSNAVIYFPVVGAMIGLVASAVWSVASILLPAVLAAGMAIVAGILLTGALHEDGLADCADGLGGGTTRKKSLEIMRDSRIGSYGALALIVSIGLRWSALATLTIGDGVFALIAAHALSRTMILLPIAFTNYAREDGLGQSVSDGISASRFWLIGACTGIVVILAFGTAGLIAGSLALLTTGLFTLYLKSRIGGYTGDTLGAVQQIAEISMLLVFAGLAS